MARFTGMTGTIRRNKTIGGGRPAGRRVKRLGGRRPNKRKGAKPIFGRA